MKVNHVDVSQKHSFVLKQNLEEEKNIIGLIKKYKMENKYKLLSDKYFGFEIFEEVFIAIDEMKHPEHDMFNAGLASADAAVRRLREEYYTNIKQMYNQEDIN